MMIKYVNMRLYSGDMCLFTTFNHNSPLKHVRARIKLTYKVGYFNQLSVERGGCR